MKIKVSKIFYMLLAVCFLLGSTAYAGVPVVVVLGDDALMGKGLGPAEDGFVQTLEKNAGAAKLINLSREGETAESLVGRVNEVLSYRPNIVILGAGLNDALAQTEPDVTYGNLESILNALYSARVNVLLLGVKAPSTLPDEYELRFNRIYSDLALRYQAYFIPNLMDGVYLNQVYSQMDGVLPNAKGVKMMYARFAPLYRTMLGDFVALSKYCKVNPTNAKCNTIDF